jgi:hypothetical protein
MILVWGVCWKHFLDAASNIKTIMRKQGQEYWISECIIDTEDILYYYRRTVPQQVRPLKSETRKCEKAKCDLLKYINF